MPRPYTADPRTEGAASDTATAAAPAAARDRQVGENADLTTEDKLEDGMVGNQGRRSNEARRADPGSDPGRNREGPTEITALINAQGEGNQGRKNTAANKQGENDVREGEDLIMQENEQDWAHVGTLSRNKTQENQELTTESNREGTMQWSPVKLAGNKRTLDAVGEADDSSEESEEEKEDGEISDEGSDADCFPTSIASIGSKASSVKEFHSSFGR